MKLKLFTNVELSTTLGVRRMEGDELGAHQIVARRDAGRHVEVLPPPVLDHAIHTPFSASIKAVFGNLEPLKPAGVGAGSIVDLGTVKRHQRKREAQSRKKDGELNRRVRSEDSRKPTGRQ